MFLYYPTLMLQKHAFSLLDMKATLFFVIFRASVVDSWNASASEAEEIPKPKPKVRIFTKKY